MSSWPGGRALDGGIDEIPLPGERGRLWLCGKHVVGPDPLEALARVDASTVVCLCERHELYDRYPQYVAWLDASGDDQAVWFPMPDLHVAPFEPMLAMARALVERLDRNEHLLVHCGAGRGRAGTMAVALLVLMGHPASHALDVVARHRSLAGPEAGAQREFIASLAATEAR